MKRITIAGSSGLIGRFCTQQLLANPDVSHVVSLVRRASGPRASKLTEVVIDFDRLPEVDSQVGAQIGSHKKDNGIDAVICALGTTIKKAKSQEAFRKVDFDYVVNLAKWALASGAKHFLVVSAMGADAGSSVFYNRTKGEMEDALRALGFSSLDILRPSLLLGPRDELRPGEKVAEVVSKILSPVFALGLKDYAPIQAETVARVLVTRALKPEPGVHVLTSGQLQLIGRV